MALTTEGKDIASVLKCSELKCGFWTSLLIMHMLNCFWMSNHYLNDVIYIFGCLNIRILGM